MLRLLKWWVHPANADETIIRLLVDLSALVFFVSILDWATK